MQQAFLSYARFDSKQAQRLRRELGANGTVKIWFDREDLISGMRWRPAIRKAIRESKYFIALLSRKAVGSRGFRHTELRQALQVVEEFPEDRVFLIPTRLDDCRPPRRLAEFTYADLFPRWKDGVGDLRTALGMPAGGRVRGGRVTPQSPPARKSSGHHYRVALVDLDGRLPQLNRVARGLGAAQRLFGFTATRRRTPKTAAILVAGARQFHIDRVPATFYADIAPLDVDFTICLTNRMIAFDRKGRVVPDYFASPSPVDERVMFISHTLLGGYARRAGVGLDVALALLVTGQLVAHFLDLDYHVQTRGCPMDFDDRLDDLVDGLRAGRFCRQCSKRLHRNPDLEAAAEALIAWKR